MKILSHRGYWQSENEKNTLNSIEKSLKNGFGFESDIRDYMEDLVISHNIATERSLKAEHIFQILHQYSDQFCFAINIKSDGLADSLNDLISKYSINNYFTFDMSFPQMMEYKKLGLRYYTRQSEFESEPLLYEDAAGIWIDGFNNTDWITKDLLCNHIKNNKKICIVSPELHGNPINNFWGKMKNYNLSEDMCYLCTDLPQKANVFFNK